MKMTASVTTHQISDSRTPLTGFDTDATIPAYLRDVYEWAYLNSDNARWLDSNAVVTTILFGKNA